MKNIKKKEYAKINKNDNPVTDLDPRLPPIFSDVLRLVTAYE